MAAQLRGEDTTVPRPTIDGVLRLEGARYSDRRGEVEVPFADPAFREAAGRGMFAVQQTILTRSRLGAVRGVHYTATPPGTGKLVHCVAGQVLDIAVDLRTDSPTFGQWDAFEVSGDDTAALYIPVGVGHLWIALSDGATLHYLLSAPYRAELERAVHPADPDLGLPLPPEAERLLSERDANAPTLREAAAAGLLPDRAASARAERATESASR